MVNPINSHYFMPKNQLKNPERTSRREMLPMFEGAIKKLSIKLFGNQQGIVKRSKVLEGTLKDKIKIPVKALNKHVTHNRKDIPESIMLGYEVPAGDFECNGEKYQLQLRAVRAKKLLIKRNEIVPIISKFAVLFKLRVFIQMLVTKLFFSDQDIKK